MTRAPRVGILLAATLAAASVGAQGPAPGRPTTTPGAPAARDAAVATVGQLRIGRAELDQNTERALQLFQERNQAPLDPQLRPLVRRQVLENLIRQRLLTLEARRRGVTVTEAELDAQVRRDPAFQTGGRFNEAKYLAAKSADPEGFARAVAVTREAMVARKVSEQMDRETQPDAAVIRIQLERELSRVSMDHLGLRRADFDGSYPEPREAEILAGYAADPGRFRVPEQARLSVIRVDRPPPDDSAGATAAGFRAWEQRMRARADSALAAIRRGARFEELAALHGGVKRPPAMRRDRTPEFWRGTAREVAAVFAASPGTILSEPVRATTGWALVRVDAVEPAHTAPLRDVARELRGGLRAAALGRRDADLEREVYAAMRDSLRGDGYRVRYAFADTAAFDPGEPRTQDLDRYYRAHLADYSSYDRTTGMVAETPLAQVRDDVRRRWASERRRELARAAADKLGESWKRGRRDASLERTLAARELGPVPAAAVPDTGPGGAALGEQLARSGGQPGVSVTATPGGVLVVHLLEVVRGYVPTLEHARPLLAKPVEARRRVEEEAAARARYERDSTSYRAPARVLFSRLLIERPPVLSVPLTRDEVERYYSSHMHEYSVEELVRVRHILISPTGPGADADAAARARAEGILQRVRAGEDFAKLAAESSDDPATRYNGGDVGTFRRGQMREAFERAAFAMRPGDITGPVRSEVGYHVLECLEYYPPVFHPLPQIYGNVAYACALRKSVRIAADRADSLYRTLKSVAHAKAVARRQGLEILATEHQVGLTGRFDEILLPYIQKLEKLKPGVLYPGTQMYEGLGQVISWVDTVIPPRQLPWDEAIATALDGYRWDRRQKALLAKRAELDSMMRSGMSFDSVAAYWGGLERVTEAPAGTELTGMGGRGTVDSLLFGRGRPAVLEPGMVSDWIEFPGGFSKLRVVERMAPDPEDLARRVEQRRQLELWRNLNDYFGRLKSRYPVEILDSELRATVLPEPTES